MSKDHHLLGTTWKSTISITKWNAGQWGFSKTRNCWFVHCGKILVKVWKPKFMRKSYSE